MVNDRLGAVPDLLTEIRIEGPGIAVTAVGSGGFVPTASSPREPGMRGAILEAAWRPHRDG